MDVTMVGHVEHDMREIAARQRTNALAAQRLVGGQDDVSDMKPISVEKEHRSPQAVVQP